MTSNTNAFITYEDQKSGRTGKIFVQFNPADLADSYNARYTHARVSQESGKNFVQVNRGDFTVKLFYDTSEVSRPEERNVADGVKELRALQGPTEAIGDTQVPPICTFVWGNFVYRGVVTSIQANYGYFSKDGFPLRADVSVTFSSSKSEHEAQRSSSRKNSRVLRTVRAGDRLDLIAADVYGDPGEWPRIAEANGIADPVGFPAAEDLGSQLAIPEM